MCEYYIHRINFSSLGRINRSNIIALYNGCGINLIPNNHKVIFQITLIYYNRNQMFGKVSFCYAYILSRLSKI